MRAHRQGEAGSNRPPPASRGCAWGRASSGAGRLRAGVDGLLVGEALMTAKDPAAHLRALRRPAMIMQGKQAGEMSGKQAGQQAGSGKETAAGGAAPPAKGTGT